MKAVPVVRLSIVSKINPMPGLVTKPCCAFWSAVAHFHTLPLDHKRCRRRKAARCASRWGVVYQSILVGRVLFGIGGGGLEAAPPNRRCGAGDGGAEVEGRGGNVRHAAKSLTPDVDAPWLPLAAAAELVGETLAGMLIRVQCGELPAPQWRLILSGSAWVWQPCWHRVSLELADATWRARMLADSPPGRS